MSCSWISLTCFAMLQGATITPEQIEFFEKQVRLYSPSTVLAATAQELKLPLPAFYSTIVHRSLRMELLLLATLPKVD